MEERNEQQQAELTPEPDKEEGGKKVSAKKYRALEEKLEKAEADVAHWKNEYYRAYADTQNLRKALEEETRSAIRYRAEGFLAELLPALDAFHLALEAPAPTKECENYLIGFGYLYNQLIQALESEGVKEIVPQVGQPFDATTMHAMEAIEDEEAKPGTILKVYGKGYMLHDRLIRPARVGVAKAKEEPKEEKEEPEEEIPQA